MARSRGAADATPLFARLEGFPVGGVAGTRLTSPGGCVSAWGAARCRARADLRPAATQLAEGRHHGRGSTWLRFSNIGAGGRVRCSLTHSLRLGHGFAWLKPCRRVWRDWVWNTTPRGPCGARREGPGAARRTFGNLLLLWRVGTAPGRGRWRVRGRCMRPAGLWNSRFPATLFTSRVC
jgi:hypothetical protein